MGHDVSGFRQKKGDAPKISLVIPVFEEEAQIAATVDAIDRALDSTSAQYRFVLIDDGSRDQTWARIETLAQKRKDISAIRFSRNFGKESAICAGLQSIDSDFSDACVVIDADLQHPPDLIPVMLQKWAEGYDVVEGVKRSRGKEGFFYKLGAFLFYRVIKKLSGLDLDRASDLKLLDRKVVQAWQRLPEKNTFFRGMVGWLGFKKAEVQFDVAERASGRSKWSKKKLFELAVHAIASYSSLPLQIVTVMGGFFFLGSVALAIQTLYMYLSGEALTGFTTVILLLLIVGSAIMISLGIIGIYIAKIFDEVKNRPRYMVSETTQQKSGIQLLRNGTDS